MVASVKRNGIGFARKFKRKTSFTLLEMRLKILRLTVLFSTGSMHSSNTSVFTRMFFGIMPSDRRFPDMIVDTSRETTFAERTGPATFAQRDGSRSIHMISNVGTDGEDLRSVDTRVTTGEVIGASTRQGTTGRSSSDHHSTMGTCPLALIFRDGMIALFLTPDSNQLLTTRRRSSIRLDRRTSTNMG